jgi:drug/metabolite transporter (DMT)-like permease
MSESTKWMGIAALGLVIAFNSAGNLLLKLGANSTPSRIGLGLLSLQSLAGIACFGGGILVYAWALKQFPLHVAQIVVSLQYLVAIVLAAIVLGEAISPSRWAGIALIVTGLFLCSR